MKQAATGIDLTGAEAALAALAQLGQSDIATLKTQSAQFLHSDDPEVVHQFRVALRRLRALLWAYQPLLRDDLGNRWRRTLGEVAGGADAVRDWDILVGDLWPAAVLPDTARSGELRRASDHVRRSARVDCRDWLAHYSLSELAETLAAAFDEASSCHRASDVSLGQFAQERIGNNAVVAGRHIAELSPVPDLAPTLAPFQHWLAKQEGLRRQRAVCELAQLKLGV